MESEKYTSGSFIMNIFKGSAKQISISIYEGNVMKHQKAYNISKPTQLKELQLIVTSFKEGYIQNLSIFYKYL